MTMASLIYVCEPGVCEMEAVVGADGRGWGVVLHKPAE